MEISDPWRERAGCFSFIGHQKVLAEQVTHKKKKEKVFLFPISQIFWASIQYERKKELSHVDKEVFWNPITRKIHRNKFPPDVYIHNKRNCVHFVYPFHSSHTDTWPGYCRKQSCSSTQLAMDQVPGYFTSPGLWQAKGLPRSSLASGAQGSYAEPSSVCPWPAAPTARFRFVLLKKYLLSCRLVVFFWSSSHGR